MEGCERPLRDLSQPPISWNEGPSISIDTSRLIKLGRSLHLKPRLHKLIGKNISNLKIWEERRIEQNKREEQQEIKEGGHQRGTHT